MQQTKIIFLALIVGLLTNFSAFAQYGEKASFPAVGWVSKSTSDVVTVLNGAGIPIIIFITVTGSDTSGSTKPTISLRNCGSIKTVEAGNSIICYNNDANNPVNFNSDGSQPVAGTYQVKPQ